MTASIKLDDESGRHHPGETVTGTVEWSLGQVPVVATLKLLWRTEGKSWPADTAVAGEMHFDDPRAADRRAFRLILPVMPYSYSGSILSIVWHVEFVMRFRWRPQKTVASRVVTMSPTGDPIDPYRI